MKLKKINSKVSIEYDNDIIVIHQKSNNKLHMVFEGVVLKRKTLDKILKQLKEREK